MSFRFYTSVISRASRAVAAGIFITGMVLIGFGFMIYLLPKFFATLAALVFFITGIGCGVTAVRIFLAQRKFEQIDSDYPQAVRKNVKIHIEEHHDA